MNDVYHILFFYLLILHNISFVYYQQHITTRAIYRCHIHLRFVVLFNYFSCIITQFSFCNQKLHWLFVLSNNILIVVTFLGYNKLPKDHPVYSYIRIDHSFQTHNTTNKLYKSTQIIYLNAIRNWIFLVFTPDYLLYIFENNAKSFFRISTF